MGYWTEQLRSYSILTGLSILRVAMELVHTMAPQELINASKEGHPVWELVLSSYTGTPSEALAILAKSHRSVVRMRVARHPNLTPEIAGNLVRDISSLVRENLASNPLTPPFIREELQHDWSTVVAECAKGDRCSFFAPQQELLEKSYVLEEALRITGEVDM